jgi:hypothetical protein
MDAAALYVLLAQGAFWTALLICILRVPQYTSGLNRGGISNYGSDRRTAIPYSIAFLGYTIFLTLAAVKIPSTFPHSQLVTEVLLGLVLLFLLVLLSSYGYKKNPLLHRTHFVIAIITLTYQTVLSGLLVYLLHRTWLGFVFLAVQGIGDLVCLLSLRNIVRRLLVGQMVASLGLFLVLFLSVDRPIPMG